ncbi:hypothetical protein [Microbacterium sp. SORGH_AS_0888]|uniref:hypothetical protein n=1 Tax=Microbacterium sp. SORGH_AS_0888 TaxID=3041791 RepID=UPI00277FA35F|nr:hypothetical protein [Microbacterium sp. SORGH_AS_0888]MDQ1131029.1 hypothetical protein [Microbacterium sp. SORGH_AS_0888]
MTRPRRWRLTVAALLVVGVVTLSGCTALNGWLDRNNPTQTAAVEEEPAPDVPMFATAEDAYKYFAVQSPPDSLTLKAGASPEEFGRWIVKMENTWMKASCDKADDIFYVFVNQFTALGPDAAYTGIAQENAKVFVEPIFGKNWKNSTAASRWMSGMTKLNADNISWCIPRKESYVAQYEFVSAAEGASYTPDARVIVVTQNQFSANPEATGMGEVTFAYTTTVEDGNLVLVDASMK